MSPEDFKSLVRAIVAESTKLREAKTNAKGAPVNYACVFSQSEPEYEALLPVARDLGRVVQETAMGPVFYMEPFDTSAGPLRIVKVRKPDPRRKERGDADFTVSDYVAFKKTYLGKPGFSLIKRTDFEMMELIDPAFSALAYFSNPPLGEVLGLDY